MASRILGAEFWCNDVPSQVTDLASNWVWTACQWRCNEWQTKSTVSLGWVWSLYLPMWVVLDECALGRLVNSYKADWQLQSRVQCCQCQSHLTPCQGQDKGWAGAIRWCRCNGRRHWVLHTYKASAYCSMARGEKLKKVWCDWFYQGRGWWSMTKAINDGCWKGALAFVGAGGLSTTQ